MMTYHEMELALDKMPILKGLLKQYVKFTYEDDAEIDNYHLVEEYLYLKKENNLSLLFKQEYLDNTHGLEGSEWL